MDKVLVERRNRLFGSRVDVAHQLNDLCICTGIPSYWSAMPKMVNDDVINLISLVTIYNAIDYKNDTDGHEQREVLLKIEALLKQIIAR